MWISSDEYYRLTVYNRRMIRRTLQCLRNKWSSISCLKNSKEEWYRADSRGKYIVLMTCLESNLTSIEMEDFKSECPGASFVSVLDREYGFAFYELRYYGDEPYCPNGDNVGNYEECSAKKMRELTTNQYSTVFESHKKRILEEIKDYALKGKSSLYVDNLPYDMSKDMISFLKNLGYEAKWNSRGIAEYLEIHW